MLSKLPYLLLLALFAVAPIACSSSEGGDETVDEGVDVPDWFINVPSEPGQAFYGVGVNFFKSSAAMQLAIQNEDLAARRQIADTMQVTIQAATRNYMQQVMTSEGEIVEESFAENVARSVTNVRISGVVIVRRTTRPDNQNGTTNVFSLARIGFDNVADTMRNELNRRVAAVRERADQAFDNLDDLIAQDNLQNQLPPAVEQAQQENEAGRKPLAYGQSMEDPAPEAAGNVELEN